MFDVMRGDAYEIAFGIYGSNGIPINPTGVADVEISLGDVVKKYSTEELHFAYGKWVFPLTKSESEALCYDEDITVKVKIKTKAGEIVGRHVGEITLKED